jgi:hypothetical protein
VYLRQSLGFGLGGIISNLLVLRKHYDIALRDFGLSLAALALWRLSKRSNKIPEQQGLALR